MSVKRLILLDNFILGKPDWLKEIEGNKSVDIRPFDISQDDIKDIAFARQADFVIHMASIASPVFYRQYPLQTLDANVWGLRKLLDFYSKKDLKGFLFFSSSEIYGDPAPEAIPTKEEYLGPVNCLGPRACYDEAKRFGETLCYVFAQTQNIPIRIVRPFNNYGPGMRLEDGRVPADFARAVLDGRDIVIYSDGSPKRTFCYVADAITGYLKVLTYSKFEVFNIGIDHPEISMKDLAEIYRVMAAELLNYRGNVTFKVAQDRNYLTHNPSRRCPDISKAKSLLGFSPQITAEQGVKRFLEFLIEEKRR